MRFENIIDPKCYKCVACVFLNKVYSSQVHTEVLWYVCAVNSSEMNYSTVTILILSGYEELLLNK